MKKIALIIILILNLIPFPALSEIVYIDINFILNNSKIGKSLNQYLKKINNENLIKYKDLEKAIINKEKELIATKNIIDETEYKKKITILSKEVQKFRLDKKTTNDKLNKIKIENTNKILGILNPIITDYVNKNAITLVIDKKNIIIGKTNLDITKKILELLNNENKKINF